MIKYKIDIYTLLSEKGINMTYAKKTGIFSQSVMQKFKRMDTSVTISCLDKLCDILDLQPSDILEFERRIDK